MDEHAANAGAEGAGEAVGVADGQGGHARFSLRGEIQTVACMLPRI